MKKFVFLISVIPLPFVTELPAFAQQSNNFKPKGEVSQITISENAKDFITEIRIRPTNGRVTCRDILAGLARVEDFDDSAFVDLIPSFSFRIQGFQGWGQVALVNRAMPRGVSLQVEGEWKQPHLVIRIKRKVLQKSRRILQRQFRESVVGLRNKFCSRDPKEYGLFFHRENRTLQEDQQIVLLVPGYQAKKNSAKPLVDYLQTKGFVVATFAYPNDQPIKDSAKLLVRDLQNLASQFPKREIRVISHSMGSLVVRWVVENPELDPGNIKQLIMVAPPNQGSQLAYFGFALEMWEHLVDSKAKDLCEVVYAAIEDGLDEASEDLQPGSIFLQELNSKERNQGIQYSILLGNRGLVKRPFLTRLRKKIQGASEIRLVRFFGPKLDLILADMDEVVDGKGDSAVSLERGRLPGVADIQILLFDHQAISRSPKTDGEQRLRREILKRLRLPL